MKTTLGATAYDWVKLGTDTAVSLTNTLVNKGNNSNSSTTQQTIPTTNYNGNPTGYAQPTSSNSNTLLYIGAGVLGLALVYMLLNNNSKKR